MPSYSGNAFSLEEAHTAATAAGFKPSRLGNRGRFSFNSRACHVGGDNPAGCWADDKNGRVYFHCHKHKDAKTDWLEAQRRVTVNLGLPEFVLPGPSNGNGQPYQVREWTYHNRLTGEDAVQVVERYDGACWRRDCTERFAHKHPRMKDRGKWQGWPTDGFQLLEHTSESPENRGAVNFSVSNPCSSCNPCSHPTDVNGPECDHGTRDWGIITEGETTAESAAACGWRAFSYLGGASGAGRADYSDVAGMKILVAPDNDRPGTGAALSAAIGSLRAGAAEVRIMPTDAFRRRGEDLADLERDQRARVIEEGWFTDGRQLGPLILELAAHNLEGRCLGATKRPLIEASDREHLDEHVEQVWKGILEREERLPQPALFVKDGRLVYLATGDDGEWVIAEHTRDSIAIVSAASVFWYQGFDENLIVEEPPADDDLSAWEEAAAVLDAVGGREHGRLLRQASQRQDEPETFRYVLRTPRPRHPQRSVTNALLVNPPEDVPQLEAVITHPFLNAAAGRLITEEGYHLSERLYLRNPFPFEPLKLEEAKAALDDLFFDFPFPTAADCTNLFAAIVTKICRRSYSKAPLMMVDKPKSGTGATLLTELVALLTTGRLPMRATYSPGEMLEFEKRVASTCRDANGIVLLDNLAGTIVSSMLADLLTAEDKFPARDLGFSRNFILNPRNYMLMATANNVSMAAELVNRTLHIRLDAGVERPDHRNGFRHHSITDYLLDNLPRMRNAALSLVHHWLEVDRPPASDLPKALRRFPAWQRQTAAILEAAGFADFTANAVEFEERAMTDAEASQHPFIQWWWDTHRSNPVGVKELATMALGNPDEEDADGMLQVKGTTEKIRRINLSKLIKTWLHQTFELSDTTVRIVAGPLLNNRTPQWMLQEPNSRAGAFPLLDANTDESLQGLQELQGLGTEKFTAPPKTGGKRACERCERRLLPDEAGPECGDCANGRRDPLEVRRMLTGEDAPREVQP